MNHLPTPTVSDVYDAVAAALISAGIIAGIKHGYVCLKPRVTRIVSMWTKPRGKHGAPRE
ncbi:MULTISPECIES: hypothetical protein [Lacticaseibacillus]|uniref:hypothetical protein n=1 Tax=Lacticaseibacillus TaxID=2759736 RepID=UPI00063DC402|nr:MULTISPECIES: hypothetical protein [Lacticaseibacillus]KLI77066.1 hypothetical protein AAW28_01010 [Lacticaseibacillus casei]